MDDLSKDRQTLGDAAVVLQARLRFDELVAAVHADLGDDQAVAALHLWLVDVQPAAQAALERLRS